MSNATLALTILGMGLITFAIRAALFLLPAGAQLPQWLLRALRYVPAAVLICQLVHNANPAPRKYQWRAAGGDWGSV